MLYVEFLLNFISEQIQHSRHFAFYLSWIYHLLMNHTNNLKPNSSKILNTLCNLEKNLTFKHDQLGKMSVRDKITLKFLRSPISSSSVENNIFTIDYLSTIASIPETDETTKTESASPSKKKRKKFN